MRARSPNVFEFVDFLSRQNGVIAGNSEADLLGQLCVLYTLGPRPQRFAFDVPTVMNALKVLLSAADPFYRGSTAPIFRPCPVFSLKQCFAPGSPYKCRVVFDVDSKGDSTVCPPANLVSIFVTWLETNVDGAPWNTAAAWVWGGSFPDKPQSFHVYFPDYVWAPHQHNLYKTMDFTTINAALQPYGLHVDGSITTSGIKLFQSDKWLAKTNQWRGIPQALVYIRDDTGDEIDPGLTLWEEAFASCVPLVDANDPAYEREVNYKLPAAVERPQKRQLVRAPVVVEVPAQINSTDPLERLFARVPEWRDVPLKRIQNAARPLCVVPVSTHCPLKTEPSDDHPAFVHSTPGKSYVLVHASGLIGLRCHICNKQSDIPPPPVPTGRELEAMLHERFSTEWARGPPGKVIRYGCDNPYRPPEMHTVAAFVQSNTRNGEKVNGVVFPKYWFQMPDIPSYPNGFGFFPTGVAPPGYFNVYMGFDYAIEQAQLEFQEQRGEHLLELMPNWLRLVRHNICGDDDALFRYFMNWMAFSVQFPHKKPLVALVLIGRPGLGKGMAVTPGRRIHGRHGLVTQDIETKFNAPLGKAIYLQIEELKRNESARNNLKLLVTETRMMHESKGQDQVEMDMFQHIVITSNDLDAVWWQAQERRFIAFPCEARLPDWGPELQKVIADEFENIRALGALKQYWSTLDLSEFVPTVFPSSSVTFKVQFESLTVYEKYLYFVLRRGSISGDDLDLVQGHKDYICAEALAAENARIHGHAARPIAELASRNWHPTFVKDALPKFVFVMGFCQMFPTQRDTCRVPLWKFLHELREEYKKRTGKSLFTVKQVRLPENRRIEAVLELALLEEWRTAFQQHRGNLDAAIWDVNGVEI